MAAGTLMTFAPVQTIFFIDVGTAALAVSILLFLLKTEPMEKSAERRAAGYFHDLKEGIAYQRSHPYLRRFFLFSTLFFVLIAPAAMLTPLQVVRSFGEEVWRLTAIEIAFSAGMMGGGALAGIWKGFKNRVHTMALATGLFGLTTLGLGLVPWFWIYLALMAGCGLSVPLYNTPAVVILQERVEPEQLGRVFGVMTMISSAAMPLAMLFFGPIADILRIEVLLIATGVLIGLLSFFLLGSKTLVEAGRRGEIRAA